MKTDALEPIVTQSDVYPARSLIIVMEHTSTGPVWVYAYVDTEELCDQREPEDFEPWVDLPS